MRLTLWLAMMMVLCACGRTSQDAPGASSPSPVDAASPTRTFQRDPKSGLAALPALGESPIELKAHWQPMVGLAEFLEEPEYGPTLQGLKPDVSRTYASSSFLIFLPAKAVQLGAPFPIPSDAVPVGTTWSVPPTAVAHFLKQFHPSATADLPIDAPGAFAVLRARSQERWEIDFRAHIQFEVAKDVFMTPSQFEGRLLVNLAQAKVEYVDFVVPQSEGERTSLSRPNVAMDAARGDGLAGVGFLPRMELVGGDARLLESTDWVEQMPRADARRLLGSQFYPFQAVEWSPLKVALARASIERKPLLAIVIAGPLDDQSC
jgi:hypothetical protein